jgi:hypothetical protein
MWTAVNLFCQRLLASLRETRRRQAEIIIARYRQPAPDETHSHIVDETGSENIPRPGKRAPARRGRRDDFVALPSTRRGLSVASRAIT